jgi:putative ABC transport system permease protein
MYRNYFKIGWRNLFKKKGYAIINIGGLAIGFACSILIFLFVSHHLQFDNFHNNSDRIYRIVTEGHRDQIEYEASVPPGFAYAFRSDYDYAEKVAKIVSWKNQLITVNKNNKLKEDIAFAEQDFFEIFNFPLLMGNKARSLSEPNTAVITESMAKKLFGDEYPMGKTFQLEGKETITITGILKDLPKTTLIKADLFISFASLKKYSGFLAGDDVWGGISAELQCFALLHPNQNIGQIEGEIFKYVKKYRPNSKNVHHYKLQPLSDIHFSAKYRGGINPTMLWTFSLIGFFLLLMASINFINITTAQSITRSKEVGVRKVLGSYKSYLFWQFMTETFLVTLIALLLGVFASTLALPYFNDLFGLKLAFAGILNLEFLGFICLLLVGITILAGSYPGILLARIAPVLALKGKLSHRGTGGFITRKVLVSAQFVISIVLIIGTFVVNKQINYATNSDLGFDKNGIVRISLPSTLKPEKMEGLKSRIAQLSGVDKITACFATPGAPNNSWNTNVRYNNKPEDENFLINTKIGDEDYLKTFDLKLSAGRNFSVKGSDVEVIVNEMLAKKLRIESPEELLGKPISMNGGTIKGTIVGVIADFHDQDFHKSINPIFIAPLARSYNELAVKINMNNTKTILTHIENQWAEYFPNFIFEYDFLDDRIAELYKSEQQFLSLTKVFSALAVFIGCLGIYGLILFYVTQKTKEIGIRKVLGGNVFHILVLVMQDFFKLVVIAGVIASPLAWYFMREWLQNYAYKTELSWWIFALAIGVVMGITLSTICYQAIKASRANPVNSLRAE